MHVRLRFSREMTGGDSVLTRQVTFRTSSTTSWLIVTRSDLVRRESLSEALEWYEQKAA